MMRRGYAARRHEALEKRLGTDQILRDIDTLRPGQDFAQVIGRAGDIEFEVPSITDHGAGSASRLSPQRIERCAFGVP